MIALIEVHVTIFGQLVHKRSPGSHVLYSRHNINRLD